MLASALREQLAAVDVVLLATDRELDIAQRAAVLDFARREQPSLIINAAAYTQVDEAEAHEADALRVNADGPTHLAEAAREIGGRLLHFSTDYVFDGLGRAPYPEPAPTAPQTAYGRSKLRGEQGVLDLLPAQAYVVRTSWLFGHDGPNFVRTMLGLMRSKEELNVVDDQHGRPTYTVDLARAALALVGVGDVKAAAAGLYHFANADAISWHGFALEIRATSEALGQSLAVRRIVPVTSAQFVRPAPRPAYSVLDTSKIERVLGDRPRSFRPALRDYLLRELELAPKRSEPVPAT
jgi:dTDP-4-dehydrorhamnose reductase